MATHMGIFHVLMGSARGLRWCVYSCVWTDASSSLSLVVHIAGHEILPDRPVDGNGCCTGRKRIPVSSSLYFSILLWC